MPVINSLPQGGGSKNIELIAHGRQFTYSWGDKYFERSYFVPKTVIGMCLGGQIHTTYVEFTTTKGIERYDSGGEECKIFNNIKIENVTKIEVKSHGKDDIRAYSWFAIVCEKESD